MQQITSSRQEQLNKDQNGARRLPGRPRNERSRQAILRSTLKLLRRHGFAALSIEAVAADAHVGKATVYRWWPTKGALVVDAFSSSIENELHFPDSGSVREDMRVQMNQYLEVLRSRSGRIIAGVIAAGQSDPSLMEEFRARFLRPRRQEAYRTLQRGIDRKELPRDLDLDLVLDLLYGGIYMRFLIRHDELNEGYVDEVCRIVLAGALNGSFSSNHKGKRRSHSALA
ncbi:MAG TPA: TetR/AcrR family transcriptional regulator [Terriglobales bacterium]|jgi:AcrR family transcriptional regulator